MADWVLWKRADTFPEYVSKSGIPVPFKRDQFTSSNNHEQIPIDEDMALILIDLHARVGNSIPVIAIAQSEKRFGWQT